MIIASCISRLVFRVLLLKFNGNYVFEYLSFDFSICILTQFSIKNDSFQFIFIISVSSQKNLLVIIYYSFNTQHSIVWNLNVIGLAWFYSLVFAITCEFTFWLQTFKLKSIARLIKQSSNDKVYGSFLLISRGVGHGIEVRILFIILRLS